MNSTERHGDIFLANAQEASNTDD
jgi:hypothetical protein